MLVETILGLLVYEYNLFGVQANWGGVTKVFFPTGLWGYNFTGLLGYDDNIGVTFVDNPERTSSGLLILLINVGFVINSILVGGANFWGHLDDVGVVIDSFGAFLIE